MIIIIIIIRERKLGHVPIKSSAVCIDPLVCVCVCVHTVELCTIPYKFRIPLFRQFQLFTDLFWIPYIPSRTYMLVIYVYMCVCIYIILVIEAIH
jgi:hypothetical protein